MTSDLNPKVSYSVGDFEVELGIEKLALVIVKGQFG